MDIRKSGATCQIPICDNPAIALLNSTVGTHDTMYEYCILFLRLCSRSYVVRYRKKTSPAFIPYSTFRIYRYIQYCKYLEPT